MADKEDAEPRDREAQGNSETWSLDAWITRLQSLLKAQNKAPNKVGEHRPKEVFRDDSETP